MEALLQEAFSAAGFVLSERQTEQFRQYFELLIDWNQRINLTAIEDPVDVVDKHFIDSVLTMKVSGSLAGKRLIDVGTGAGFPGVPLKIMAPELSLCLFDSLQKRINFLTELCSSLDLSDVEMVHGRAEEFGRNSDYREQYDLATARAVAKLPVLAELCLPFVKVGGVFIALKGPELEQELNESKKALQEMGGKIMRVENIKLGHDQYERNLVVVEKMKPTPKKYPRKAGTPQKSPIA